MVTEDYVSFEIAKLLKEKGFNGYTHERYGLYVNGKFHRLPVDRGILKDPDVDVVYTALTHQMAMKWLREVHHIHIRLINSSDESYRYEIYPREGKYRSSCFSDIRYYETYEEACEAAIKYCLENLI